MLNPLVFLIGCIGSRSLFTWLAYRQWHLTLLAVIAAAIVAGWLYIMLVGHRDTGPEVGGGKIWWQHIRPLHALLWATFVFMVATGRKGDAWKPLAADTALGLSAWVAHRVGGVAF